ncbi:type II toxin-antitoxin system ChpB family toxin [Rheinheimera pacifica]|uniref:type II toxin-antitoxin system ChpB family toxin n=1 Tax=Rheinheimera pacifica TaxID=173990 RepID=UPI002ED9B0C7
MAVFDRGDIVRVCLNPTAGKEIQGDYRPCLVLTQKAFNQLGMTLIAPISQGADFARIRGFAVPLMGSGTATQGVVLVNGIRMADLVARQAKKVETAPKSIVNEVLAVMHAIIE